MLMVNQQDLGLVDLGETRLVEDTNLTAATPLAMDKEQDLTFLQFLEKIFSLNFIIKGQILLAVVLVEHQDVRARVKI